ncbi:restriction endonuclease subunit S [Methanomethylovorans sp.]|uniref:restriction endonuclease subunit S n=1 Tax=Methanomethylovorans sp. TaxID=2758717 RepID=UPI003D0C859E
MSEWIDTTLGEILTLQRGFDLPEVERLQGIFPVIASTGQIGTHQKAMVSGPGVVIGRSGSIGGGQYIQSDFWPLNTTLWVKDFKGNDVRFCYYLLKSMDLTMFNVGSGVPTLNRNHIHPISVSIPSNVHEQRAIAHILGTLDDKIELNRRMNETLEAMARAIFKSWFVDFDPVRAKAEGRDTGLPEEIADLFPDSFEETELGEVPEGWRIDTVESLCESITSGGTPARKNPLYWEGGTIPWFKTGELLDGPLLKSEEHITEAALTGSSCKLWPAGTILFALYASPTVGRLGVLTRPGTSNQAAAGLIAKSEYGVPFLRRLLLEARVNLQTIAVGAAQQNINQGVLKSYRAVIPKADVAVMYSRIISSLDEKQIALSEEAYTLAELRDTLLPKLISGELRLRETEGSLGLDI